MNCSYFTDCMTDILQHFQKLFHSSKFYYHIEIQHADGTRKYISVSTNEPRYGQVIQEKVYDFLRKTIPVV